jgi:hypothetical protein
VSPRCVLVIPIANSTRAAAIVASLRPGAQHPGMVTSTTPLLAELPEHLATGEIAEIYDEIRRFSGVPYVSSLQRFLATMPGVLEWAWEAVRPAMVSGAIPETGWRLAGTVRIPPLPTVTPEELRVWQVDAPGFAAIRNVAANFLRVSPVNLMTGACLKLLLTGSLPAGFGFDAGWRPPDALPPMPGNIDPGGMPPRQRAVLLRFATQVDGTPFIPALYRQLAHWPCVLTWLADALVPRLDAPETNLGRTAFRAAAADAAPEIVARLPHRTLRHTPDKATARRVLATIDRYAMTSPEMTMFGQALLEAFPVTLSPGPGPGG